MRALEQLPTEDLERLAHVAFAAEQASSESAAPVGAQEFWSWLRAVSWVHIVRRRGGQAADEPGFPALSTEQLAQTALALTAMLSHEETRGGESNADEHLRPALIRCYAELAGELVVMAHDAALGAGETLH